jgi:AcrR family transcriptional regulator
MESVAVEKWPRERRRALTRTALLDAAAHVFARRGFEGASLDEIAETAGFTRGAIYKHFDGKESLLLAVYDRCNERTLQAFADQIGQGGRAAALDAHALAKTWAQIIAADSDLFALELEFRLYEIRNPSARKRSLAQRRRNREMVAQFLREQKTSGIKYTIDPDTLAGILLATSDGFVQAAQADAQDAKLYKRFLELFLPAVITEK